MSDEKQEALTWQIGVWDRMAEIYHQEIDTRFGPVIEHLLNRAELRPGETVLDLGTGTGTVAILAASRVAPDGYVTGIDISTQMIEAARARAEKHSLSGVTFTEGGAEAIPLESDSVDVILASLSMMYVIDREKAANEIARVLRPGGRFVASVWASADEADIVLFQETAGRFAPPPPVSGVGPGGLGDPGPFLSQLEAAGLAVGCERVVTTFQFDNFEDAWEPLAGVTAARLPEKVRNEAKAAVREAMWPDADAGREFRNTTQYIFAEKADQSN